MRRFFSRTATHAALPSHCVVLITQTRPESVLTRSPLTRSPELPYIRSPPRQSQRNLLTAENGNRHTRIQWSGKNNSGNFLNVTSVRRWFVCHVYIHTTRAEQMLHYVRNKNNMPFQYHKLDTTLQDLKFGNYSIIVFYNNLSPKKLLLGGR